MEYLTGLSTDTPYLRSYRQIRERRERNMPEEMRGLGAFHEELGDCTGLAEEVLFLAREVRGRFDRPNPDKREWMKANYADLSIVANELINNSVELFKRLRKLTVEAFDQKNNLNTEK